MPVLGKKSTQKSEDVDIVLLREPKDSGYYEFSANDELVITKGHNNFTPKEEAKSFHADTYCFDSKPEKECFLQYISSNKVKEIYFTGMFTSNQGDLSVQYYDPESKRLRKYYPDFLALMEDGSYQLIEVKGDNKIDDKLYLPKKRQQRKCSCKWCPLFDVCRKYAHEIKCFRTNFSSSTDKYRHKDAYSVCLKQK